jgi:hypothetical protein
MCTLLVNGSSYLARTFLAQTAGVHHLRHGLSHGAENARYGSRQAYDQNDSGPATMTVSS